MMKPTTLMIEPMMKPRPTAFMAVSTSPLSPVRTRVGADDRADDADGPDQQRKDHALVPERGVAENHGGDDGHLVTFENVGGHAGTIADVVAHVVGDGGSVAWIVFGDVLFNFTDQVGADVGSLGINAAADTHEQGQQGAAEAEAEQGLVGFFAEVQENQRTTQKTQTVGKHAGDGAGAVADLHGSAETLPGRGGDTEITGRGQTHADEADGGREDGPDQESDAPAPGDLQLPVVFEIARSALWPFGVNEHHRDE